MGTDRNGRRFGSFPTTADVGIWATAATPSGLFEGLGLALSGLGCDRRGVRPLERRQVHVSAADPSSLVVAFLTELVLLRDAEGFLVRDLTVRLRGAGKTVLDATVVGETFDAHRHRRRMDVKAVTLHRLTVSFRPPSARVIVDI